MPHYTITAIASRSSPISHLTSLCQRLQSTIQSNGGVLRRVDHLGLRPLAYRIKAHQVFNLHGRYFRLSLTAAPTVLAEIEKRLRVDEGILRFLTIRESLSSLKINTDIAIAHAENDASDNTDAVDADEAKESEAAEDDADTSMNIANDSALTSQPIFVDAETLSLMRSKTSYMLDYFAAKTLLDHGLLTEHELSLLPRHRPDPEWDAQIEELKKKEENSISEQENEQAAALAQTKALIDQQLHAEFESMSLYHRARLEEVAKAQAARAEWRELELQSTEVRAHILDAKLIAKRVRKAMKAFEDQWRNQARNVSDTEKEALRAQLRRKFVKERKENFVKKNEPLHIDLH